MNPVFFMLGAIIAALGIAIILGRSRLGRVSDKLYSPYGFGGSSRWLRVWTASNLAVGIVILGVGVVAMAMAFFIE